MRDDLYEQCSDHITAYIASSRWLGSRPRIVRDLRRPRRRSSPSARCSMHRSHRRTAPCYRSAMSRLRGRAIRTSKCASVRRVALCLQTRRAPRRTDVRMSTRRRWRPGDSRDRAVRKYLEALEAHKPKRGRKRTPDSIKKRLNAIEAKLADADPLTRAQARPGAHGPAERARVAAGERRPDAASRPTS